MLGTITADALVREGTTREQVNKSFIYSNAKTIIKAGQKKFVEKRASAVQQKIPMLPSHSWSPSLHMFWLWTSHKRLKRHLFNNINCGNSDQCFWQTGNQTRSTCPVLPTGQKSSQASVL
ncbi:hypothetical protein PoB_007214300 [Plakobranchus ocellatus]|uniref:Uncharacterized protein n=1 Tax=Plakobranchus ocellatus TaxID=259542 RepID=A0AAV4DNK2_9GAST|nr:hypothetical protein PoB_007214300 [Plakobranchus ocellatus]